MTKMPSTPRQAKGSKPEPSSVPARRERTAPVHWQWEIELERLRLEKEDAEFRRNEAEFKRDEVVARLAIELGKKGTGRDGKNFVPDVARAVQLLTDSAKARADEVKRTTPETAKEMETRLIQQSEKSWNPPLVWHSPRSKPEDEILKKQILTFAVLCQSPEKAKDGSKKGGPKKHETIKFGLFELKKCPNASDSDQWKETQWRPLGSWEILREEKRLREIVKLALQLQFRKSVHDFHAFSLTEEGKYRLSSDFSAWKAAQSRLGENGLVISDQNLFQEWQDVLDYRNSDGVQKILQILKNGLPTDSKLPQVTDEAVSQCLKSTEISEEFFRHLKQARNKLKHLVNTSSAPGEAKPPRRKRMPAT